MSFSGAFTALVTPLRDGELDLGALEELVEWQIGEGIDGLVPCGTTGESATLSPEEQAQVIRTVVTRARGRVPVVAGAGANSTRKAIDHSRLAQESGADGLLQVTPYYNKPMQSGLTAHFRAIAEACGLPVVLYNVPGRTACDLRPETVASLAQHPHIVAIKEATGSIVRAQEVLAATAREAFSLLSGDDFTCLATTLVGGRGVISVVSNLCPKLVAQMIAAAREGAVDAARRLNAQLQPLMSALFAESNPIPVKAGASFLGFGANEVRLPLQPLSGEPLEQLRSEMRRVGVLS